MVTITVSGLHGVGKTTTAKKLAEKFDLRYVSAGTVFRQMAEEQGMTLEEFSKHVEENPEIDEEIDQRTAKEA
ncbi:cytidylate kinase, partial [candidate division MSBL1 archaeon SCGC-AAA261O19]